VQLVPTVNELVATSDFVSIHATKTPETIGLINADVLSHAKPGMRLINAGRGAIVDEAALADAITSGKLAGAAIDTFATEPTTESPLFGLENVVVTPHLGASTAEAQDKAGETIAEMVVLALRGDFVPFAVNVAASEASETVRPFLPLAERIGRLFTGLAGSAPGTIEIEYEGEIADYDCRVLTLSVLKGVLAPVVDEPVSFVNAPQIAEQRGLSFRETKASDARDYVNLIIVRGDQGTQVAATLFGKQQVPRIVSIDGHSVDLPPARHMLVVHNDDSPGVIGRVGTVLGDEGINISNMDVGQSPSGEAALMVIATEGTVPPSVVELVAQQRGVQSARAIDLG
jgi:D-3-phosphoglycerate dehydrogenase